MMAFFTRCLFILVTASLFTGLQAQDRYVNEIFSSVTVEDGVSYGRNYSAISALAGGTEPLLEDLVMDVYQPEGDTVQERPLVLLFHTGNFLPQSLNMRPTGTRKDSVLVGLATRLAQRGFVAASVDYRLGWNPLDPNQSGRVSGLINAVYRTTQDARTCVRFFKKNFVDEGNTYRVDTSRIIMIGAGSGGYIVNATVTIDRYEEILLPKFFIGGIPMVIEAVNGNVMGTSVGIIPQDYPLFSPGDTLNLPNWVTYDDESEISSDFQFAVNLGGALGDSSWIDENTAPWITFHNTTDPDAPYEIGIVNVPGPDLPVVEAHGGYINQPLMDRFGNNDAWADVEFIDPFTAAAESNNQLPVPAGNQTLPGLENVNGLYAVIGTGPNASSPWDWWGPNDPFADAEGVEEPNVEKAKAMQDTILNFTIPRMCIALNMDCNLEAFVSDPTSTEEVISAAEVGLSIFPNPATESIILDVDGQNRIQGIQLFDLSGRVLRTVRNINQERYQLDRGNLQSGVYFVKILFDEGFVAKQVVFK